MRRRLSDISSREERVSYIQRLIVGGRWVARHDLTLAKAWGISDTNVRALASEARAAVRRAQTPEAHDDLQALLMGRLDRVYRIAIQDGDTKTAVLACRELARISGLDKRTVTHEVTADDFFPKEDK